MKKTLGLYIHIPFCKTICTFCNFLTFAHKNKWIPEYIETLQKELISKSSQFREYKISTIYFGGGTPSLIEAQFIESIIDTVKNNYDCSDLTEISLEANPESVTSEKLNIYRKAGVTRLSLGVQTLNNKALTKIARPHNSEQTLQALEIIKNVGWKNFGCDLIIGMPYQTVESFTEDLKKLLSYSPAHLSAYFLSMDTKRIETFIKDSPDEDNQIKMYWKLLEMVSAQDFQHYEVSNYAIPGFESQHNLRYWTQQEYLGFGIGAHSYIDNQVKENIRDFDAYLENPLQYEDSYELDEDTKRMDFIMLSLRRHHGIDLKEYLARYGEAKLQELIKQARGFNQSLLKLDSEFITATESGFLIIDKITRDLL